MPEGDAVRRTAARLDRALAGRTLLRAELRWPSAAGVDLVGRTVLHTRPYGKHLLTRFDDGRTLHTHLRMDGAWHVVPTGSPQARARRSGVRAVLGAALSTAIGHQLGMMDVLRTDQEPDLLAHLGPDVLDDVFDDDSAGLDAPVRPGSGLAEGVARWADQGPRPACDVLLDQTVVAGLGTIWMAESLFGCRLSPWTAADRCDPTPLLRTARRLMLASLAARVPATAVHGRLGRPCVRCGTPVTCGVANEAPYERPVFWCPTCQRDPADPSARHPPFRRPG